MCKVNATVKIHGDSKLSDEEKEKYAVIFAKEFNKIMKLLNKEVTRSGKIYHKFVENQYPNELQKFDIYYLNLILFLKVHRTIFKWKVGNHYEVTAKLRHSNEIFEMIEQTVV